MDSSVCMMYIEPLNFDIFMYHHCPRMDGERVRRRNEQFFI